MSPMTRLPLIAVSLSSFIALAQAPSFIEQDGARGDGQYSTRAMTEGLVDHTIEIFTNGNSGRYCVKATNQCGQLTDIQYDENGADITGNWNFNGSRGTFSWNFVYEDQNSFQGGFRMARQNDDNPYIPFDGTWVGKLNRR